MNIFLLNECPVISAQEQCNKHVVKMILESAQMLSTVHRLCDGVHYYDVSKSGRKVSRYTLTDDNELYYKAVHQKHPCVIWTGESKSNYDWHYRHFIALCNEYTFRYGKTHMSDEKMRVLLSKPPKNIPDVGPTKFRLAMAQFPECIVEDDPVESYRNYYVTKLSYVKMVWHKREVPEWFLNKMKNSLTEQ